MGARRVRVGVGEGAALLCRRGGRKLDCTARIG